MNSIKMPVFSCLFKCNGRKLTNERKREFLIRFFFISIKTKNAQRLMYKWNVQLNRNNLDKKESMDFDNSCMVHMIWMACDCQRIGLIFDSSWKEVADALKRMKDAGIRSEPESVWWPMVQAGVAFWPDLIHHANHLHFQCVHHYQTLHFPWSTVNRLYCPK